jgi:hypothetical protein
MKIEVAEIYSKNKSLCETVKKEKASFSVTPQTAKVPTTVHNRCLLEMEKAHYYRVWYICRVLECIPFGIRVGGCIQITDSFATFIFYHL